MLFRSVVLTPKGAAGSADSVSQDLQGDYFMEFDDAADEWIADPGRIRDYVDGLRLFVSGFLSLLDLVCTQTYIMCFRCDVLM